MSSGCGWKVLGWMAVLVCMPVRADEVPVKPPPVCSGRWGELRPAMSLPVILKEDPERARVFELQRLNWNQPDEWAGHVMLERGADGGRWRLSHYLGQQIFAGRPAPEYDDGCPADEDWRTVTEVWALPLGACPAADRERDGLAEALAGFVRRFAQTMSAANEPFEPVETTDAFLQEPTYTITTGLGPTVSFSASEDAQLVRQSERLLGALRVCSATLPATRVEVPGLQRLPPIEDIQVVDEVVH